PPTLGTEPAAPPPQPKPTFNRTRMSTQRRIMSQTVMITTVIHESPGSMLNRYVISSQYTASETGRLIMLDSPPAPPAMAATPASTHVVTPSLNAAIAASLRIAVAGLPKLTPSGPAATSANPIRNVALMAVIMLRPTVVAA